MKLDRFFTHPILLHRRSRIILGSYLLASSLFSLIVWNFVGATLSKAGVPSNQLTQDSFLHHPFLFSNFFRAGLALLSGLIAAGLTASHVIGPVKRIEQWLSDWEVGHRVSPLQVRPHDHYHTLISVLNDLNIQFSKLPLENVQNATPAAIPTATSVAE